MKNLILCSLLATVMYQQVISPHIPISPCQPQPQTNSPTIMQRNGNQITAIQPSTGRLWVGTTPREGRDSVLIQIHPGRNVTE